MKHPASPNSQGYLRPRSLKDYNMYIINWDQTVKLPILPSLTVGFKNGVPI